jgi:hypothetical protein
LTKAEEELKQIRDIIDAVSFFLSLNSLDFNRFKKKKGNCARKT